MPTSLVSQGVQYPNGSIRTSGKWAVRAIFGYGLNSFSNPISVTNLVNNYGGVSTDTTGVGTARYNLAAAGYGGDKAIFGYGVDSGGHLSTTNLVSNVGVVGANVTGVGTARSNLAAAGYGGDKAIFGYGSNGPSTFNVTNLVSNVGVVGANVTGVGTPRFQLAAASYGGDKAIFGFGSETSISNLVSNTGVVATDQTALTGTARSGLAAAGYGGDKAIFGFGGNSLGYRQSVNVTNLVSNTGVVASDQTALTGSVRELLAAAGYGGDKAIFGYGYDYDPNVFVLITNLVSNTGVVATDVIGVGTARLGLAAASYSS